MPTNPKKREQQVMKKRRKEKAAARKKAQQGLAAASAQTLARRAREFPIMECLISEDWQDSEEGLVLVVVARQQPNGAVTFASYMIDVFCLGVKDTLYDANISLGEYKAHYLAVLDSQTPLEKCPPELAHQMVYQAIDYAAQFEFEPQRDFRITQHILEPQGTYPETYHLTFGKDGKPFYVQGPHDNARAIIAQLERTAGPGNYDYFLVME
jgi:hypothetical protein